MEPLDVLENSSRKPADIYVPRWFSGKDSAYDVTVVNPLQIKYIDKAGTHAGLAAAGASARKVNALRSASEFSVINFVPLAVECFGRWDPLALQHFSALARRLSLRITSSRDRTLKLLMTRLSCVLQKGNAACRMHRFDNTAHQLEERISPSPNLAFSVRALALEVC